MHLNKLIIMKTFVSISVAAAFALLSSSSFATVWRVNNNSTTPSISTNFTALSTAISSALVLAGDTLYVEGSSTSYGSVTLSKRLTIIGAGYFLTNNDSTQAFPQRSLLSAMTISSAAAGSVITGISFEQPSNPLVTVSANDITFDRCSFWQSSTGGGPTIRVSANVQNTVVRRSFLRSEWCSTCNVFELLSGTSNTVIDNNIIKLGTKNSTSSGNAISMHATATAIIRNNVINGPVNVSNSIYNNNIHIVGSYTQNVTMVSVLNNIGNSTQYGTANGNQQSVNMTNVFTYAPGNENVDNHYRLKAGSPALGAGVGGTDCGAFGGTTPYVLSGMPAIPAIFQVTLGSNVVTSASGLQINTKSKAHD